MIPYILMIVGGFLAILGIVLLGSLLLEPLYAAFMIVFLRKDDYVIYEKGVGKRLLTQKRKELVSASVFLIIAGAGACVWGYYLKFGFRGDGNKLTTRETYQTVAGESGVVYDDGHYVTSEGILYSDIITVSGDEISFNNTLIGTVDDFAAFLNSRDRNGSILLIDDYATYKTYSKVKELLDINGITYKSDSENDE